MKQIAATLILFFTIQFSNAQSSCCSATLAFNDISVNTGFQDKHELKAYSGPLLKGKMMSIPIEGEDPAMIYTLISPKESNKYLFVFHLSSMLYFRYFNFVTKIPLNKPHKAPDKTPIKTDKGIPKPAL